MPLFFPDTQCAEAGNLMHLSQEESDNTEACPNIEIQFLKMVQRNNIFLNVSFYFKASNKNVRNVHWHSPSICIALTLADPAVRVRSWIPSYLQEYISITSVYQQIYQFCPSTWSKCALGECLKRSGIFWKAIKIAILQASPSSSSYISRHAQIRGMCLLKQKR